MILEKNEKSKLKIGLVFSAESSLWMSCIKINENLKASYSSIPHTIVKYFGLYDESSEIVARNIESFAPDILIVVDHQVRLSEIFHFSFFKDFLHKNQTKLAIHVYGCFFDRIYEYHQVLELGIPVQFFVASEKHGQLVKACLSKGDDYVKVIPFPASSSDFYFDGLSRKKIRSELGFTDEDDVFIYTGRISGQKNVEVAMDSLAKARSKNSHLKFIYVGPFIEHDYAYSRRPLILNGMQAALNGRFLDQIDPKREWCFYLPKMANSDLNKYLSAADAFISLSTTRGEDYGMSVLEAKFSGLPTYLSDWGGYSGFKTGISHFYPFHWDGNYFSFQQNHLIDDLSSFKKLEDQKRDVYSREAAKVYGSEAIGLKLDEVLQEKNFGEVKISPKLLMTRNDKVGSNDFLILNKFARYYEFYWK